jgi:dienelactone hydrolase
MHGRTVDKSLDPGRYLRWVRAGVAACAIDLPGHGERPDEDLQSPAHSMRVLEQALQEVDTVVATLDDPAFRGAFDTSRIAIGGMSLGGMVALARLCHDHPFACAAVEATSGDLTYARRINAPQHAEIIDRHNPIEHLERWRPIPLLALHSERDEWTPVEHIRSFIDRLRDRYAQAGANPDLARLVTWPETGAPYEHIGFGNKSNEAKNLQTDFLARHLGAQGG